MLHKSGYYASGKPECEPGSAECNMWAEFDPKDFGGVPYMAFGGPFNVGTPPPPPPPPAPAPAPPPPVIPAHQTYMFPTNLFNNPNLPFNRAFPHAAHNFFGRCPFVNYPPSAEESKQSDQPGSNKSKCRTFF